MATPIWEFGDLKLYDQGEYLLILWSPGWSARLRNFLLLPEIGGTEVPPAQGTGWFIPRENYAAFARFLAQAYTNGQEPLLPFDKKTQIQRGGGLQKQVRFQELQRDPSHAYEHVVTLAEAQLLTKILGVEFKTDPDEDFYAAKTISTDESGNPYYTMFDFSTVDDLFVPQEKSEEPLLPEARRYFDLLQKYLLLRDQKDITLQRGDTVAHQFMGYRNGGMLIFNGKQLGLLASEPDEYGNVPKEFKVITEFSIDYWSKVIGHNNYCASTLKSS